MPRGAAHRSCIHDGSTLASDCRTPAASRLHGYYWTDRATKGDLDLREHRKSTVGDTSRPRPIRLSLALRRRSSKSIVDESPGGSHSRAGRVQCEGARSSRPRLLPGPTVLGAAPGSANQAARTAPEQLPNVLPPVRADHLATPVAPVGRCPLRSSRSNGKLIAADVYPATRARQHTDAT